MQVKGGNFKLHEKMYSLIFFDAVLWNEHFAQNKKNCVYKTLT